MSSIPNLSILEGPTQHLKPAKIHRLFEDVCKEVENNTAVVFEENKQINKYTYNELNKESNRIARMIKDVINKNSIPRNSDGDYLVAVCLKPSDKMVPILLAIWKAGAAYLPMDPEFPDARKEHIICESNPALIVQEENNNRFVNTFTIAEIKDHNEKYSSENLDDKECLQQLKDDLAIVLYTSGSTGVPKGARLLHKAIQNRLQWQFKMFPYSNTEKVCLFKTVLTFGDSVPEIWGPLLNKLTLLVVSKSNTKNPEKLVTLLEKYKIERIFLVPSLLRSLLMCLELQEMNILKNLKLWVCSGETLSVTLAQEFFKYFPENKHTLCNFYGTTEVMGDVSFHIINSKVELNHQSKVPLGVPLDNTILYVLDKNIRPVKSGEIGELFVSGLNLAAGYVNGRDSEKFINNPLSTNPLYSKLFRTGDFAKVKRGILMYENRTDTQIKIRGHRIDMFEVEKAVSSIDGIEKCIVLCYQPGEINQALLAFVTTNAPIKENQIETIAKTKLTSYMVPQVILIQTVPLLISGKIDRQALLKSYENTDNNVDFCIQSKIDYNGVLENKMDAAKILFETVAEVLSGSTRSDICINANFYEIGGNSLNSIFTINNLNNKGYHISISDFIEAVNLGEILEKMTKDSKTICLDTKSPLFKSELLKNEYKIKILDMITTSFYQKGDLEQWIIADITKSSHSELVLAIWESLINMALSFVVISQESEKIIGVSLNFDAHDEPEFKIKSKLTVILEFLESIAGPVRDHQLPVGKGKVLHTFMMATHSSLSSKENIAVIKFMEDEVLKLAKTRKFTGILTTNTNPLTQQLNENIYGYKTMFNCQINQYVASDNTKPFGQAPDSQKCIVNWKTV